MNQFRMMEHLVFRARVRGIRALVTAVMCLVSVGCMAAQRQPEWTTTGIHHSFPDAEYISGVGQGDTRDKAADKARAEISKRFRVTVNSSTVSFQSDLLTTMNGVKSEYSKENTQDLTETTTQMVLEDVRIAETWINNSTAEYYALAVLDRHKAFDRVKDRASRLLDEVGVMVAEAAASASPIKKIGRLAMAARLFSQSEPLIAQIRILNPSWSPGALPPPVLLALNPSGTVEVDRLSSEVLARLFSDAASHFPVHISVTPSGTALSTRLYSAIQDSLTQVGIPCVVSAEDSVIQVTVALTARDTGMTPSGFAFSTVDAAISVRALGNDNVISSTTVSEREGANTTTDARAKAENRIVDKVSRSFFGFIYDSLMK